MMEQEIYKENILDHYKYPHNHGDLPENTLTHREHNPLCGDEIIIYLKINEGKVEDVKFKGSGCAISIASASMLTDKIKGKTLEEVKQVRKEDILEMLGIPIGVVRMKCALLSLKTIHKGLENYDETRN